MLPQPPEALNHISYELMQQQPLFPSRTQLSDAISVQREENSLTK